MAYRRPMGGRESRRNFRGASRVHPKNYIRVMRGGYRI